MAPDHKSVSFATVAVAGIVAVINTSAAEAVDSLADLEASHSATFGSALVELNVGKAKAFIVKPIRPAPDGSRPWVWYAPSLASSDGGWTLPGRRHASVVRGLLENGFYFCGVDVGESYGSPDGRATFTKFYKLLVDRFGFSAKACLFPVSRGGLMHYTWAVEHPECVASIGAIYPVCNLASYPGIARASQAYRMTPEQLEENIAKHNPLDRLAPLAAARVPILHLHGDRDEAVPLEANSAELARRYTALGGRADVLVIEGKGHELAPEFWDNPHLPAFFLDHANWAEAAFVTGARKPVAVDRPVVNEANFILTPKPGTEPRINGPTVFGCRPGRPFLYRIPCTGQRPIKFTAKELPAELQLDATTGIITGRAPQDLGEYPVTLQAHNGSGQAHRAFKIVVGDKLALTPPMGWNSWYIHYYRVTEEHMRAAADAMVQSGMADVGYMYVNIDDCWMVKPDADDPMIGGKPRDADDAIRSNKRFPDMQALAAYIHAKGLKAGLYTSPGPLTCQKYTGSYQHEEIDARKFSQWGFDFLKYDWCSYGRVATGEGQERLERPYRKMGDILKTLDRDIVYNLCQYGMGDVWTWGGQVGGNCWRTTGDLGLARNTLLPGFYHIGLPNAEHWQHAKPGQWNDPDYILIGWVGDARGQTEGKPTSLTPNEQYSYMSMWCLMAAPLFFSGDMSKLDEFTLNVLCNPEVIDVDQDPLGKQARPILQDEQTLILAKPLEDGSQAVGLFNLEQFARPVSVTWKQLGITGKQRIRDLWRHQDLGDDDQVYTADIARHGVTLVRLWPEESR